ncbi:MAG: DNA translocase FtsK, partial [Corynebacterium sp.]|nr:DNA translocase FtsK [Corynebacterium sp.]
MTARRAADTSEERTGSAFRAVGTGIGSLFSATAGGLGKMTRSIGELTRRRDDDFDDDFNDDFKEEISTKPQARTSGRRRSKAVIEEEFHEDLDESPRESSWHRAGTYMDDHADGIALTLIGVAIVLGAAVWFSIGGPIGTFIADIVHLTIGAGAWILPVLLIGAAVALMLNYTPNPESRGRVSIGAAIIILCMFGLIHLFAGNPVEWAGRKTAGGAIGAWVGTPLELGFSVYLAIPILFLVLFYGALKTTGISIREFGEFIGSFFGFGGSSDDYDEEDDDLYGHVEHELEQRSSGRALPKPEPRE